MSRMRFPAGGAPMAALFFVLLLIIPSVASAQAQSDPLMGQYQALGGQFVQLRDVSSRRMSPQELATACDGLIGQINSLISAAAGNPSALSKSQELLSYAYDFDGMSSQSLSAYSAYLDTLASWQGQDYAVMTVRCAGDRMLDQGNNPAKALAYYGLLLQKYPGDASTAHAQYKSALACIALSDYRDAATWCDAAVATDPKGYYAPWSLRAKAFALAEMQPSGSNYSASLAVLSQLEQSFPDPYWGGYVCYRRGYTLQRAGQQLAALAEYQRGMSQYPTSPYTPWSQKLSKDLQNQMQQQMLDEIAQKQKNPPQAAAEQQHASTGGPQG